MQAELPLHVLIGQHEEPGALALETAAAVDHAVFEGHGDGRRARDHAADQMIQRIEIEGLAQDRPVADESD